MNNAPIILQKLLQIRLSIEIKIKWKNKEVTYPELASFVISNFRSAWVNLAVSSPLISSLNLISRTNFEPSILPVTSAFEASGKVNLAATTPFLLFELFFKISSVKGLLRAKTTLPSPLKTNSGFCVLEYPFEMSKLRQIASRINVDLFIILTIVKKSSNRFKITSE